MSARRPGPKLEPGIEEVRPRDVLLDDASVDMLKVVGQGNLSRGIRRAARVAYKAYQAEPEDPAPSAEVTA